MTQENADRSVVEVENTTKLNRLKKHLERVEKKLDKVRGTVREDGWQTMRLARKQRSWDFLAQEKMNLLRQIYELEEYEKARE